MKTESKRELILQNLQSTLEGIDGRGDYWTEVKSVKRVPYVPTEFEGEEKPALLIIATGEPEEIDNQHSFHDRRDLRIGLIGVMDRPYGDDGEAVNRFMKDVSIAIAADVTRGGNASQTYKVRQLDCSNLFGDLCMFEAELSIIYHCDGRTE